MTESDSTVEPQLSPLLQGSNEPRRKIEPVCDMHVKEIQPHEAKYGTGKRFQESCFP